MLIVLILARVLGLIHAQQSLDSQCTQGTPLNISNSTGVHNSIRHWAKQCGIKMEGVELSTFNHNGTSVRGLRATRTIMPGTRIVTVPRECLLSADFILSGVQGLRKSYLSKFALLAASYLWDRHHTRSVRSQYFRIVEHGASLHQLPVARNFAGKLSDGMLLAVEESKASIRQEYLALASGGLDGFAWFTMDAYHDAVVMVHSRLFFSKLGSSEQATHFLAPIADLVNHGCGDTDVEYSTDQQQLYLNTGTSMLQQGQEVLHFYGSMCQEMNMLHYGYNGGNTSSPCNTTQMAWLQSKGYYHEYLWSDNYSGSKWRRDCQNPLTNEEITWLAQLPNAQDLRAEV
jgi:hypothetical protein